MSTEIEAARRDVRRLVREWLRPLGFRSAGSNFFVERDGDWGVIEIGFYPNRDTNRLMVEAHLGVALRVLTDWHGDWDPGRRPPTSLCQWEKLLRGVTNPDWQILFGWDAEGGVPEDDFRVAVVERGAPLVLSLMSAEALRDSFAHDNADEERVPHVNYPIRLTRYLVLLAQVGPRDRILPTMRELWRVSVGQDWEGTMAKDIERVSAETGIRLSDA